MITDCPRCGRPQSAWDGQFCGRCEESYRREEEQRLRAEYADLIARWPWEDEAPPRFWDWAREQGL